jgi:pSer/pThr/pTyr-binding forkhead associated (FHA) protein
MQVCLRCEQPALIGGLCRAHAEAIGQCRRLTSEQIVSSPVAEPAAWLIDQWGCTHALAETMRIGRSPQDTDLTILHPSVSAMHARISHESGTWAVIDLDSLNGTLRNDERVSKAALVDGDRLCFGEVGFYFTQLSVPRIAIDEGRGRTLRVRSDNGSNEVVLATVCGEEIRLVGRTDGGIARVGSAVVEFARLEFGLLQCLVQRAREQDDPELSFVSWQELSRDLDFKTRAADSENVRELVRRVRRKLKNVELRQLIESRQGVGYRLAATIKSAV